MEKSSQGCYKAMQLHDNIIDIQNRLPYSKTVYNNCSFFMSDGSKSWC